MAFDLTARLRLIDGMSGQLRNATSSLAGFGARVAKTSLIVGGLSAAIASTAVAVSSVKKAMNFDSQMASIGALDKSLAKGTQGYEKMRDLALEMGQSTAFGATEAASGIEALLKAGLSPAAVQAGGLAAALNLATAGELDLTSAAEIMSTALNAFSKDGMTAARASDILAGTANASAVDVDELRQSLAAVSAVAAGVGLTFEDTNIALGLFGNKGVKSSDAGTSLKTMLQRLQPTTKEQTKLFRALGLVTKDGANEFYDANGNIKSMQSIAGSLRKSLGKLTNQQRSLALETMFGTDAIRAANVLYESGAEGVADFREEMLKVSALDVAVDKMNSAEGATQKFSRAIETLQISALSPTMPLIQKFATKAANMVKEYTPQITAAMQRMTDKATQYLKNHFTNNPEFQKITTLEGKIKFVYEDIMQSFNRWLDDGGRAKISIISSDIVDFMSETLKASQPLIDAAVEIGKSIGAGMLKGLKEFAKENPELSALLAFVATPGPIQVKLAAAAATAALPSIDKEVEYWNNPDKSIGNKMLEWPGHSLDGLHEMARVEIPENDVISKMLKERGTVKPDGSHASGLDRVPYNGYVARLHEGEEVLTKTQAADNRENGGNGSKHSVLVTGNTFHVRNDSDIDAIAGKLAHLIAQ
ncbi:phage tail tape measure protein [Cohnella mopanensis]|uniref:phage tail tape measure protein n=1 Tax=Cohnella mopanensis TaxID=2911966 RepID=UPI001EF81A02|nr:phage tail tape measure protein [Cohnella mopanensis]